MDKVIDPKYFKDIVKEFKEIITKYPDQHIEYVESQKTLADAIEVAAKAIDENGKIHGHQRRVGRKKLNAFTTTLKPMENAIKKAKNFDNLLSIIEQAKILGINELTVYDTAERIGHFLKLYPEKIYLHAGTEQGAKILFGSNFVKGKRFLCIDELPAAYKAYKLTPAEWESFLCMYKGCFNSSSPNVEYRPSSCSTGSMPRNNNKRC